MWAEALDFLLEPAMGAFLLTCWLIGLLAARYPGRAALAAVAAGFMLLAWIEVPAAPSVTWQPCPPVAAPLQHAPERPATAWRMRGGSSW